MCRDRSIATILFGLAAAIFCLFMNWTPQEGDAEVGFQATRAIARRGELYLSADTPSSKLILTLLDPEGGAYNCRKGRGDQQYPYWGLAYTVAGVPFYYLGSALDSVFPDHNNTFQKQTICAEGIPASEYFARIFVFTLQPLAAAAALAFLYIAARRAGASELASLAAALALGLGTHFGVQARSGLSDAQAVLIVSLALERALAARKSDRLFDYLTFGGAVGFGILTKIHTAFALAPLFLLFISRRNGLKGAARAAAGIAAGVAPFLLIFFAANFYRWGSPFITGYEKSTSKAWFYISPLLGIREMVFSHAKGMVAYALPLLILSFSGILHLTSRGARPLALILLLSAFVGVLMPASTIEWHGAWSFGPRYALVAYPMLAVLSAFGVDRFSGKLRFIPAVIILFGIATILPGMFTSPFGGMAVAKTAAAERWPDTSYPAGTDPGTCDANRFQRLCTLPITDPLNFLRVQHALARAAFFGRDGLSWREELNIQKDGDALPPPQNEFRRFGSIGLVDHFHRFGRLDTAAFSIILTQGALIAILIIIIRRASREDVCA